MKDDIKEILDDLLFTTTLPNVSVKLSEEKLNQLKDYITNLQEEIHKEEAMYDSLAVDYRLSQEENERLLKKSYSDDVRITKAIEYINSVINNKNWVNDNFQDIYGPQLLNLLQGGDE